ncbi:hypothetical protein PTKIN_Ptkin16aG0509300 [Pterospermum kingtungense]
MDCYIVQLVRLALPKLLKRLRLETFETFRSDVEYIRKKSGGRFKATAKLCMESAMQKFDKACKDAAIRDVNWDILQKKGKNSAKILNRT